MISCIVHCFSYILTFLLPTVQQPEDWLRSTEFHEFGKEPKFGPDLPVHITNFCAAKIPDHRVLVMGGHSNSCNSCKKTWMYNFQDHVHPDWYPKAEMGRVRKGIFGCAAFKNNALFNKTMVLVIGGADTKWTELYDVEENDWTVG